MIFVTLFPLTAKKIYSTLKKADLMRKSQPSVVSEYLFSTQIKSGFVCLSITIHSVFFSFCKQFFCLFCDFFVLANHKTPRFLVNHRANSWLFLQKFFGNNLILALVLSTHKIVPAMCEKKLRGVVFFIVGC